MGGASETNLDPGEVLDAAARLAARADSLKTGISGPAERIRSLHAARPWGDDDPGTAFRAAYLGRSGGGGVDAILDGCDGICDAARTLAENVGLSALETQEQDELLSDHLERSLARYEDLVDAQNAAVGGVSGRLDGATADGGGSGSTGSGGAEMRSAADADFGSSSDAGQLGQLQRALGPDQLGLDGAGLYRSAGTEEWGSLAGAADPEGAAVPPTADGAVAAAGDAAELEGAGDAAESEGAGDAAESDGAADAVGVDATGADPVDRDMAGTAADRDAWPDRTGEPGQAGTGPAGPPDGEVPGATFTAVREDGVTAPDARPGGGAGTALGAVDNTE